jgi:hypothetical protein
MSFLSDKYGIPEEKIKLLIKDGYISCSIPRVDEIIVHYKSKISKGIGKSEAVNQTAEEKNISRQYMYQIIREHM